MLFNSQLKLFHLQRQQQIILNPEPKSVDDVFPGGPFGQNNNRHAGQLSFNGLQKGKGIGKGGLLDQKGQGGARFYFGSLK